MMKQDAMLDALRKKKGQGIDLTIILGDQGETPDEESEELGLAPDTKEKVLGDEPDMGTDESLVAEEAEEGMKIPTEEELNPELAEEDEEKSLFKRLLGENAAQGSLGKLALASRKK